MKAEIVERDIPYATEHGAYGFAMYDALRQPFGAPTVTWRDGAIHFLMTRVGNYNIRQRLLPFDASRYGRFKVRMRITPNPQTASDGKARRMHLWGGKVNELWFEGVDLANAVVDIDWMRFE